MAAARITETEPDKSRPESENVISEDYHSGYQTGWNDAWSITKSAKKPDTLFVGVVVGFYLCLVLLVVVATVTDNRNRR